VANGSDAGRVLPDLNRPVRQWPAWATACVALVVMALSGMSTATSYSYREAQEANAETRKQAQESSAEAMSGLKAAVSENSKELARVRLALEAARLLQDDVKDHEQRLRALEKGR